MKKKESIRPTVNGKKMKIKWFDVFITTLAIVVIGGFFVWVAMHIYQEEKLENEMTEKYKASLPAPGIAVDHKLVCMVNNMYMGMAQIPVVVQNKTYYGCCEKCVHDLNSDETVRFAVDPYSKAKVDKAFAFITMSPLKPGTILYFESKENLRNYFKRQEKNN